MLIRGGNLWSIGCVNFIGTISRGKHRDCLRFSRGSARVSSSLSSIWEGHGDQPDCFACAASLEGLRRPGQEIQEEAFQGRLFRRDPKGEHHPLAVLLKARCHVFCWSLKGLKGNRRDVGGSFHLTQPQRFGQTLQLFVLHLGGTWSVAPMAPVASL